MERKKKIIEMVDLTLKFAINFKGSYVPTHLIRTEYMSRYSDVLTAYEIIKDEGFIKVVSGDGFILTSLGERVAGIGYEVYLDEQQQKELETKKVEAATSQKVFYDLANAKRTKLKDYLSLGMSAIALIISILSLIYTYYKN